MKTLDKKDIPVLIFDREAVFGQFIASELSSENLCVFVSSVKNKSAKNIIHIPLTKNVPILPNCKYKSFILNNDRDNTALEFLPYFIKKAKEDNAHIYLILNIRNAADKLIKEILNKSADLTILLAGDIFGEEINAVNPVSDLCKQAQSGSILVEDPLFMLYPVNIQDVESVLSRLTHVKGVSGHRILFLLPPHPVTSLSFVRELQKKEPALRVDISAVKNENINTVNLQSYQSVFGANYNYKNSLPLVKIAKPQKKIKHKQSRQKFTRERIAKIILILVISMMITILGIPIVSGLIGVSYLTRAKNHLTQDNYIKARSTLNASRMFFSLSQSTVKGLSVLSFIGLGSQYQIISNGVNLGRLISDTVYSGVEGAIEFKKVILDQSTNPKKDLTNAIHHFRQAVLGVSAIKAESKLPDKYQEFIAKAEKLTSKSSGVLEVLPEVLGMEKKRKYLVLFQNNMELRPGGGFIGSYGVMDVEKGQIRNFSIYDVYDADGQLTEHFEPPFQLRKYMGVSHWYLRDSNFELDFTKNAELAAFFYKEEIKGDVDGVFAIDINFLLKVLTITGPLKVPGYKETITSANFFKLAETYAQEGFFPGSNQKENYLNAVSSSLFNKLFTEKEIHFESLAQVITESLAEKHLLIAFRDKNLQNVFSSIGASSTLGQTKEKKENSFNDFIGINEANIGENKVNYYLDRSVSHRVDFSTENTIRETVSVHYINKSTVGNKYGGDYKSYLRFILPKGAVLENVLFADEKQNIVQAVTDAKVFTASGFKALNGLEVEKSELTEHTVYGFLNIVPMNKKKTVTINYALPNSTISEKQIIDYSLSIFKQPGTNADVYAFTFIKPENYSMIEASEGLRSNNNGASFLTNLLEDRTITLKLVKK